MAAAADDARAGVTSEEGVVVFGEELAGEPPLPTLLGEVQRRLSEFRERYGDVLEPGERFELLSGALDELDVALESVRAARDRLGRIEARLTYAFDATLARLRTAERELDGP